MKITTIVSPSTCLWRMAVAVLLSFAAGLAHANPVFWNGPATNFIQNNPAPSDQLTTGVSISRNQTGPLFNPAGGEDGPDGSTSPADTMWGFGTFQDVTNGTITWQTFADIRNGAAPDLGHFITNRPLVLHLLSDDIYISLYFTAWGMSGAGGFAYQRTTPNVIAASPPAISITSPMGGAVFAAPANINISTGITNGSDPVTNVAFFANTTTSLGSKAIAPFNISSGNLAAGSYALTAVATAGGISTTSSAVNINVVTALTLSNSTPKIANGVFSFDYPANPGLQYVVQTSSNLLTWTPIATNTAAANPVHFTTNIAPTENHYYRVSRLPNP